jgi:lysophospholipase L1-like esterase
VTLVTIRIVLVATALAVAIGVAEGLVRIFIPQDMGVLAPWYESHPVYRFRHYPNMDTARNWVTPYRLRTNSHAVRSDHEEPYRSPSETRIIVHGDSQTLGLGVENEDTFVYRTQQRLRQTFGAVDVLNMGVSAYGPDQEYLLFLEEGRKYSPRVCVIAVCLDNDLDDLKRSDAAFRLQRDGLVFIPYQPPVAKKLAESPPYRWLASRSHLLVMTRFNLIDAPRYARDLAAHEAEPPPLELALAIYRDFVAAVRKEGTVPVLLLLPSREQIAESRMLPHEPWIPSILLRDALLKFCAAEALTCLDALDGLAGSEVALHSLFLPDDSHFSAAGHQVIADLLMTPLEQILNSVVSPRR